MASEGVRREIWLGFSLVWAKLDVMSYVGRGSRFMNVKMLGALPSHRRASRATYASRPHTMEFEAWHLWQEDWGKVMVSSAEGMDMLVLRDESEGLYVSKLRRLARDVVARKYPESRLGYCLLLWPWHLLPFLDETKAWRSAVEFERRHLTEPDGSYFVGRHNLVLFLVLPEERSCLYGAAQSSWKEYEPCCAFSMPSSPLFAYKSNAMVDVNGDGSVVVKRDVLLLVSVADHRQN